MALADIQVIREESAKLVEAMIHEAPYKDRPWARVALAIAARAIRRGRHLTDQEKLLNLADSMEGDAGDPEDERQANRAAAEALRQLASGRYQ